jgi:hypothetical protein
MTFAGLGIGIWVTACSTTSNGTGDPQGPCDDLVNAICNKLQECYPLAIQLAYKDVNECMARQASQCVKSINAPSTGATAAYASDCAAAYRTLSCDKLTVAPDACKTPAGQLADGAPCGDGAQCTGRRCNKPTWATCGACSTKVAAGGDCKATSDCDDSLTCAKNGKCVVPAKAGAACGDTQPCEAPLGCSKGTCAAPLGAGASCAGGEACDAAQGLYCSQSSKTCTLIKFANPGEACRLTGAAFVGCAGGGTCKAAAGTSVGTCQAAAADGASCATDGATCEAPAQCLNGVCTIPDPGACK